LLEIALDKVIIDYFLYSNIKDLEPSTVALAYVLIDKLVLKHFLGKENLYLVGGK
jgi:hypothetical protein